MASRGRGAFPFRSAWPKKFGPSKGIALLTGGFQVATGLTLGAQPIQDWLLDPAVLPPSIVVEAASAADSCGASITREGSVAEALGGGAGEVSTFVVEAAVQDAVNHTTGSVTPDGTNTAVFGAACNIDFTAGGITDCRYGGSGGTVLSPLASAVLYFFDFGHLRAFGAAGSPTASVTMFGDWPDTGNFSCVGGVFLRNVDQTTPFSGAGINNGVTFASTGTADYNVSGLTPGQRAVAVFAVSGEVTSIVAGNADTTVLGWDGSTANNLVFVTGVATGTDLFFEIDVVSAGDTVAWAASGARVNDAPGGASDTSDAEVTTGGGYSVSVDEPTTADDSASASGVLGASTTEPASAADTASSSAVFGADASESASAADAPSAALAAPVAVDEPASAADAPAAALTISAAASEAGSADDAVSAQAVAVGSISEAASADDVVSSSAVVVGAVTEPATGDDASSAVVVLEGAVAEAGSAADDVSSTSFLDGSITEPAAATDTTAGTMSAVASVDEAADATDEVSSGGAVVSVVAEAADATDGQSATGSFGATVAEPAAAADIQSSQAEFTAAVAEPAAAADTQSSAAEFGVTVSEPAAGADQASASAVLTAGADEGAAADDATAGSLARAGSVDEPADAEDDADSSSSGSYNVDVDEAADAQDEYAANLARVGVIFEQASAGVGLSAEQHALLESLARVNGLVDPLTNTPTTRGDGTLEQTISEAGATVTVTTVARPTGAPGPSDLTSEEAAWLEALARRFGLIDPMDVTVTQRSDGTLTQTIAEVGTTVTVTRV
jgi:hypothetical protein